MRNIIAIYRRELGAYFVSPIAYAVTGIFLLVSGFFFYNILGIFMQRSMMPEQFGGQAGMDVPGMVIRNFFDIVSTIILFMLPMLTMGIYAEDRKRGTMELLMTSPITELQIVTGKYLAALTLFVAMLAPTLIYHLTMGAYSEPALPWKIVFCGYLGIFLLGAALVAIGNFISSLTESQIIAGVATFAAFLLLWVLNIGLRESTTTFGEIIGYLSLLNHFDDFAKGVIDTASVIFYASLVALALFLTQRSLDSMRWRKA
jgi:ABC-2 type transport system permease protein